MSNSFQNTIVSKEELPVVPIHNGQVIQTIDSQEQYFDYNDKRIRITDIVIVNKYNDLRRIANPIEGKFYFVKDPEVAQLYYFDGNNFVKTSGYAHPIYDIKPGTYHRFTVNQMGHITAADNDTLPMELGGTGVNNLTDFEKLIKSISDSETSSLETKITENRLKIENIESNILSTNRALINTKEEIDETITSTTERIDEDISDLSDKIDSILTSYYIRESSKSDWILDNADKSYYIMILKSDYGLLNTFPNVTVYKKIDSGYQTTKGLYDNTDYTIIISDNYDITIKTSNPFACKIIITTI